MANNSGGSKAGVAIALAAVAGAAVGATYFLGKKGSAQLSFKAHLPDGTLSTTPTYHVGDSVVFVFTLPDTLARQASTVQWISANSSIVGTVHSWDYAATGDSYFDQVGTANTSMVAETPLQIWGIATLASGQQIKSNTITFTVLS